MNRTTNAALLLSMLPALNYPVRLHDLCFDLILQLRSYFKSHESSGAADLSLWRSPPSVCVCGGGYSHFFLIRILGPGIYRSPQKYQELQAPHFLSPDPKRIGGYSDQPGVRPSVRLSVCPSFCPSVDKSLCAQ